MALRVLEDICRESDKHGRATLKASALGAARRPSLFRCISTRRSGFRLPRWFHGVRNNRSWLRYWVEPSERIWRRLPYELEDGCSDTQNTCGKHRCFHRAAPFFFRARQDPV